MSSRVKRRTARIRNELRLWLRARYGRRFFYTQKQIDIGREELGFRSVDDAFIAYSLFGADLSPGILSALDVNTPMEDLSDALAHIGESPNIEFECFSDA